MADPRSRLLQVFHEAASQDFTRMRQAEELLKQWESEPHFFSMVQDIFYDSSIHHDVRFLSGIYLKNGVGRFWRRTVKSPINPEEKNAIRQRLLQFLSEPSKRLTAQNAVIVARIARLDYPMEWPELLPSLIQAIEAPHVENEDQLRIIHDRAFEMLYEVLLELSTRLLSAGRRQFAEIAPRVFQTLANGYVTYTNSTINKLTAGVQDHLQIELGIAAMSVKCLRIVMVSGIRDVHKYDETKTFIDLSRQRLMDYMKIRSQLVQSTSRDFQELVDTLIEEHGALYLALQKTHPVSCALCPAWPSILLYYWQTIVAEGNRLLEQYKTGEAENTNVFQQFLLQGMLLVKDTIKHSSYNVDSSSSDVLSVTDEEKAMAAEARTIMHTQFITPDFVNVCAETLVSKYMLLTPSDMEKWEEEPESWANTIDSENWEFELRPCAEMTFMSLLTQHRDQLCPILLDLAEKVANVSSYEELLFKEAVYAAIGLGVQSIYGRFDFEAFLANRLMPEIFAKGPSLKILHRRIAWLLGKWVNEGISADSRVAIYQGLLELMTREDDMVVRLTAAHSLRLAIDDWDFEIGILLPYLGPAMDLLLQLLNEVTESETIMKLIADINAIADRTGSHMEPYAGKLIELLVPHWSRAQEEPLFQSALVTTFSKIAAILKEQSVQVQGLFLPIVQTCVDRNNKAHVYLLEDALDLWWTMLQTAPANNSQIFSLLPIAIELLDYDTECMRKVIKIIESYLLLDGHGTIQQCGLQLFSGLSVYIGSSKSEVASNISNVIETALQMCPVQTFGGPLVQSGLLGNILNVFLQDKLYAHAIMSYMAIFARLAICDAQFLLEFIQMADREVDSAPGNLLGNVLDKWMDKFDNIGHPRARKLHCIGLTNLLNTHNAAVTARLPNIMAIWIDVLPEVNEAEEDAFLFTEADMQSDLAELDESAEKDRKMIMRREDPVYRSDLVQLIRQTLGACEANMGGSQQFQQAVLSTIDPTLLDQLNKSLTGQ